MLADGLIICGFDVICVSLKFINHPWHNAIVMPFEIFRTYAHGEKDQRIWRVKKVLLLDLPDSARPETDEGQPFVVRHKRPVSEIQPKSIHKTEERITRKSLRSETIFYGYDRISLQ